MAPLIDRNLVERANTALLLATLWGALATCVLGALAYDIAYWLDGWSDRRQSTASAALHGQRAPILRLVL